VFTCLWNDSCVVTLIHFSFSVAVILYRGRWRLYLEEYRFFWLWPSSCLFEERGILGVKQGGYRQQLQWRHCKSPLLRVRIQIGTGMASAHQRPVILDNVSLVRSPKLTCFPQLPMHSAATAAYIGSIPTRTCTPCGKRAVRATQGSATAALESILGACHRV
jgi:hypothetical protein